MRDDDEGPGIAALYYLIFDIALVYFLLHYL